MLEGRSKTMDITEFQALWKNADRDFLILDCRAQANARTFLEKYPDIWQNIPQDELRARIGEVPRDREIVLFCNAGGRSYEAQITLDSAGIPATRNLQGGVAAVRKSGMDI
jgi:rhodanese-related sulfurtransferase